MLEECKRATRLRCASPSRKGDRVDARPDQRPPSTALREEEEFPSCPVSTKEAAAPACPLTRRPAAEPPVGAVMRGALGPYLRVFLEEWRPLPLRLPRIALVGNPPGHQDLIAPLLARTQVCAARATARSTTREGRGSAAQGWAETTFLGLAAAQTRRIRQSTCSKTQKGAGAISKKTLRRDGRATRAWPRLRHETAARAQTARQKTAQPRQTGAKNVGRTKRTPRCRGGRARRFWRHR